MRRAGAVLWLAAAVVSMVPGPAVASVPPGVRVLVGERRAVVEIRIDPAAVRTSGGVVRLPGWSSGPGTDGPPLPRADLMVPAPAGSSWVVESVRTDGERVVSAGSLEPAAFDPAATPPPGVPPGRWAGLLRREVAARWRFGPRHPVARTLDPVRRGGRRFARLRIEPVRWNPDEGTLTVPGTVVVTLVRTTGRSGASPGGVTPPSPPYRAADPSFPPRAFTDSDAEGILHLDWSELGSALGWDTAFLDGSRIQVWEDGVQLAIDVADGEWVEVLVRPRTGENVAGEFRRGDWTDDRVYWFIVGDGTVASRRVASRSAPPAGGTTITEYPFTVRLRDEGDCRWVSAHVPSPDDEIFHWRSAAWSTFYSPPEVVARLPLELPGLAAASSSPVTLTVHLLGAASLAALSPQHRQVFRLLDSSGQTVAEVSDPSFDFDGNTVHEDTFTLTPSEIAASDGLLRAVSTDPTGRCVGPCPDFYWDVTYVDWVDVTYPRTPVAVGGACPIVVPAAGTVRFRVSGVPGPAGDVRVWDVTDPAAPVRLTGWTWSGDMVDFEETASSGTRYLVVGASGFVRPAAGAFRGATVHDWAAGPPGGADWIAIGPRSLVTSEALSRLAAARRAAGLRTAVVPVEEIWDEFSFGVPTPWAIRSFVTWARGTWAPPAPSRVLLVGDATSDTKNQARPCVENCRDSDPENDVFGPADFPVPSVPTWVEVVPEDGTGLGMLASDSWYGRVDGDAMPDVAVGRLPARSAEALERMVDRILAVEGAVPESEPWTTRFAFVAGARDAPVLEPVLESLAAALPAAFARSTLFFADAPWNGTTADADGNGVSDMVDTMNGGRVVVDWLGHSGFDAMEAVPGATALDVADLEGPGANLVTDTALLAAGACYVGAFDHLTVQPTLGEALLGAGEGGAAAVLAHAASSYVWAADEMLGGVQDTLTGLDRSTAVGDAHAEAVWRTLEAGHDVEAESLVLLGDPAMRVPVPDPPAPGTPWVVRQSCARLHLSWAVPSGTASCTLYRSVDGGPWEAVLSGIRAVPVEDPLTPPGTTVSYRVTAVDPSGFESGGSGVLTVTVPQGTTVTGDVDCSCTLEAADLAAWIVDWDRGEDPCGTADVDLDGTITPADLPVLTALFF